MAAPTGSAGVAQKILGMWSRLADKPAGTHHLYASVLTGGERNRVLNQSRAGLAANNV